MTNIHTSVKNQNVEIFVTSTLAHDRVNKLHIMLILSRVLKQKHKLLKPFHFPALIPEGGQIWFDFQTWFIFTNEEIAKKRTGG